MSEPLRYSDRPFPPYTYVPGKQPHPVSDPRGHMHGQEVPVPPALEPGNWSESETYRYAVDLFNYGFYWEAHEVWESLWIAAGRTGTLADFLKGLIKLAAAGVKELEGNSVGVQRHRTRSIELLEGVHATSSSYCGNQLANLLADIRHAERISDIQILLE